jgi:hypothetical protein
MSSNATSQTLLTLEERKGLLWFQRYEPTQWPGRDNPPSHRTLIALMRAGLIHFWPGRKRFDPPIYCLTEAGRKALQP